MNTIDTVDLAEEYKRNLESAQAITNGSVSLPYAQRSLEIAEALDDDLRRGKALMEISYDYDRTGNLVDAFTIIIEAAEIFERSGNTLYAGIAYNSIGTKYLMQENYNLAIHYLFKALKIHQQSDSPLQTADDMNNLGEVYRLNRNLDSANYFFRSALTIYSNHSDSMGLAYSLGNIGLLKAAGNDPDSAEIYIRKASTILENLGNLYPIVVYKVEQARILLNQDNLSDAEKLALEAFDISENENLKSELQLSSELLVDIFREKQEWLNAFIYLEKMHSAKDSLVNANVIRKMADLRTEYEIGLRETEISNLEKLNRSRRIINTILSLGVGIVVTLMIFLIRANRFRKRANQKLSKNQHVLEQKNTIIETALAEKEILLREIHHRVKNNLQIISSLLSLQSSRVDDPETLMVIDESQQRLQAIALIHQKLYQQENLGAIQLDAYSRDLVSSVCQLFKKKDEDISLKFDIANVQLDLDTIIPLGLIINELTMNSLKYAFPQKSEKGQICLSIHRKNSAMIELEMKDNGQGLRSDLEMSSTKTLGLTLVKILAKQLHGTLSYRYNNGAEFTLQFRNQITE